MSPRNQNLVGLPVNARLVGYATLAGAALAAPQIADATIIWSGPVNINIPSTTAGVYLNIVTGVIGANPAAVPGWDVNPWSSTTLNMFTPTPNPGGGSHVGTGTTYFNLTFVDVVGPGSTYSGTGTATINAGTPLNLNSSNNFVGFRFINEAAGGQIQYGWMRISLSSSASAQPRTIVEYSYDDTGAAISVGLLPEPSTLALFGVMAAGAAGVRIWRRRKTD